MRPFVPDAGSAEFSPPFGMRHASLQTTLGSKRPVRRLWQQRGLDLDAKSARHVLDCGGGVRLTGVQTPAPTPESRGLVVLIHGWEGSHDSNYLYSMAARLHVEGYATFRLNLRDHGGTHALNEELFHSARIAEVLGALKAVSELDATRPLFVVGFSLGGNFALRLGLYGHRVGVAPALSVGVCPAIVPGATLTALDSGPALFHRYFIDKWRKTLLAKQAAWPGKYDFSDIWPLTNFTEITARFVERYTEFGALEKYLASYTLTPDLLRASPAPLAIITAQDDPVVPFRDFAGIEDRPGLRLLAPKFGGHCGFVEGFGLKGWAEHRILELFREHS